MNNILEEINEEIVFMTYNSALHKNNVFDEDVLDFEAGNNGWYRVRVQHVAVDTYDVWVEKFEWRFSRVEKFEWRFSKTPFHGRVFLGVNGDQVYGLVDNLFH